MTSVLKIRNSRNVSISCLIPYYKYINQSTESNIDTKNKYNTNTR